MPNPANPHSEEKAPVFSSYTSWKNLAIFSLFFTGCYLLIVKTGGIFLDWASYNFPPVEKIYQSVCHIDNILFQAAPSFWFMCPGFSNDALYYSPREFSHYCLWCFCAAILAMRPSLLTYNKTFSLHNRVEWKRSVAIGLSFIWRVVLIFLPVGWALAKLRQHSRPW